MSEAIILENRHHDELLTRLRLDLCGLSFLKGRQCMACQQQIHEKGRAQSIDMLQVCI